ncbi:MAG: hypothetical protein LUG45_05225 [Clostridiales bacterium]|nr:hypothetical protein [Clostridiales bacterium]
MPISDKKRATDAKWKQKNFLTVGCRLYRGDAEEFRDWCSRQGLSVNQAIRGYVAECLGRPLERRDGGAADPAPEAEPGEDN